MKHGQRKEKTGNKTEKIVFRLVSFVINTGIKVFIKTKIRTGLKIEKFKYLNVSGIIGGVAN